MLALIVGAPTRRRRGASSRPPRRVGLRAGAHARRLSPGARAGRRLRRAGSGGDQGRRAHLPARPDARAHHQRRRAIPDRATDGDLGREDGGSWLANDFTLAEIKPLDAGSWFDAKFKGERVPTFDEAVALVKGKAGLFPELKTPEVYSGRDVEFEALVERARSTGMRLRGPAADAEDADHPADLQRVEGTGAGRAMRSACRWCCCRRAARARPAGAGRGLEGHRRGLRAGQGDLSAHPDLVKWAHAEGMTVMPYTFRAATPGLPGQRRDGALPLHLGVDGLFTDNPDQFPRR